MSEKRWTPEQWEAITESGGNLLVAAAAGAGKTAVLVERIIRKITDEEKPVDIDRLLVVTFTNAAATEMRERIAEAISKVLDSHPGSRALQRQMVLLNKASITTIHSFCLEVIRNHFQQIDLDPDFRIADETEALLLKTEALEELFEEVYTEESCHEGYFELLDCYGGNRDDRAIQEMVLGLYEYVQSAPWPEEWLSNSVERFHIPEGTDLAETVWGKVIFHSLALELQGLRQMMCRALEAIADCEDLKPYYAAFHSDYIQLEALIARCQAKDGTGWDQMRESLIGLEFEKLGRCGKDADRQQQERVKAIRDDVKTRLKKLSQEWFHSGSGEMIRDLQVQYPVLRCLCGLVSDFAGRYSAKKRRKQLLDFNDLEHFCLQILARREEDGSIGPSEAALAYRDKFEEIFIDEYQDSNLVQEILIRMIARSGDRIPNVFMVGDVKQSIYRFRQARPELFMEKYNTYSMEKGRQYRKVQLFKNFRSRREVVDAVNFLFKQIMSAEAGELDYTDNEALNLGAGYEEVCDSAVMVGGAVELHLMETGGLRPMEGQGREQGDADSGLDGAGDAEAGPDGAGAVDPWEEAGTEPDEASGLEALGEESRKAAEEDPPDVIQGEARMVAARIRELLEPDAEGRIFKVYDKENGGYRRVDYKDIVILLRTTRHWAEIFVEELSSRGIPAYADSGTGFFRTVEVQIILSLLQIIDNPLQDIPLLAVLRSPIASFSADDLVEVRLADRKANLYEALKVLAGQVEEGDTPIERMETAAGTKTSGSAAAKAREFLADLSRWRNKARFLSTDQLIWYLYTDTGFYSYSGAMPGGKQRQANLRILFERARQFEETSLKGLFSFIQFIERLKSGKGDLGSAKILGENENVVRIMSIHKSKGLEFPVVFLSGCGKRFNLQDMNKTLLLHQDLGFGPDFVDPVRRFRYPSIPKQALRCRIKTESLSEEMRILYVAFTRAREKLILTGSVKNVEKAAVRWAQCASVPIARLPAFEMLKGANYLDWVAPALMRHPDCKMLRELCGAENGLAGSILTDNSVWGIRLWKRADVLFGGQKEAMEVSRFIQELESVDPGQCYSKECEEIERRLCWEYAGRRAAEIPAKLSVTELKRRFASEFSEEIGSLIGTGGEGLPGGSGSVVSIDTRKYTPVIRRPSFLSESKGLSASEAGSLLHFVMQHLDMARVSTEEDLIFQVGEMVFFQLLTEQQAKAVDLPRVRKFLESSLGLRMRSSSRVYRELPFCMEIGGTELYKGFTSGVPGDSLLLQGVIDCCFEEPDGWVLLDYKTDYVPGGRSELLKDRYRLQIEYYSRALAKLTGLPVKEKFVYLFANGEILQY